MGFTLHHPASPASATTSPWNAGLTVQVDRLPRRGHRRRPLRPANDDGAALVRLAERVRWLIPDRRDPHKFFEDRDEIALEMKRLAWRMG